MDQRRAFIVAWQAGQASGAALCRPLGISRKTGPTWPARFQADGRSACPIACGRRAIT